MSEPLRTLTDRARHEVHIRKSRFLAQAGAITNEADADTFLQTVAEPAANHNCWAWRLGQNYRFSDDGEPGGSAGKPILMAIEGQNLDRVAVVVTRWFGGIKLGVGGLMRAYGGSAAECLRQAPQADIIDTITVTFELGYAAMELLRARMSGWHHRVIDERFGAEGVFMRLTIERTRLPELEILVADLSRGGAAVSTPEPTDGTH